MNIFRPLQLLLPALIPSWNFFDVIAPSPRIQYSLFDKEKKIIVDWQEFRPRPDHLSFITMMKRMFWNPKWNEYLFLVSCAERIMEKYTTHSEGEILNRIENDCRYETTASYLQFRLVYIIKKGTKLNKEVMFTSRIQEITRETNNES